MERRTLLVAGAALATAGATRAIAAPGNMPGMAMAMSMDDCIDLCMKSHRVCLDAASRLSQQAATPALRQLVILLSDCAELCGTTANSMVRGSPLHPLVCRACAEACELCAKQCREQANDNLLNCSGTCEKCAAGCRQMAAMAG